MYQDIELTLHCPGDPTHPQVPSATQGAEHNGANLPNLLKEEMLRLQGAATCIPFLNFLVQNMLQGAE